tara:strand:- start:1202 stop:1426 length:225 start_codon:yes stop_codon:yes gene_type:complete
METVIVGVISGLITSLSYIIYSYMYNEKKLDIKEVCKIVVLGLIIGMTNVFLYINFGTIKSSNNIDIQTGLPNF